MSMRIATRLLLPLTVLGLMAVVAAAEDYKPLHGAPDIESNISRRPQACPAT